MKKTQKLRILVVDDHFIVRVGLTESLNRIPEMQVVAEATTATQAISLYQQHRPDITLMDLRLPDLSGVEAISAICREFPDARVIALTMFDGDEDIYRALQAGARAYLLKNVPRDELVGTIRSVHATGHSLSPQIAVRLARRMHRPNLTPRELEVLRLIVHGKSNKEIAASLFITEGTVKIHVSNLLSALKVADRTQATSAAIQQGIVHLD